MNTKQRVKLWAWVLVGVVILLLVLFNGPGGSSPGRQTPTIRSTGPGSGSAGNGTILGAPLYKTVGVDVRLRQAATTDSAIVTTMHAYGADLVLSCYQDGQPVSGDTTWYRATYGSLHGYVAGYWVDTGPDPASDVLPGCS
jgi:hypothetical protein